MSRCHLAARASGSDAPAWAANSESMPRMFSRCVAQASRSGVVGLVELEQHVDERAALEVLLLEPLVEHVEDGEQAPGPILRPGLGLRS